jgi:type IV pilus assembly protein PilM
MLIGKKTPIGLDIGSSYLKIAQVNETKGAYELGLFDLTPLPPDIISDGLIADKTSLVEAIRELLRKSGVRGGDAVLGISGHSSVVVKRISMPMMTEDELGVSIKYEAEQYIPFDINDVKMDFQILGPKKDEEGQMDVVLVAVKNNVMDDYIEVATKSGLKPVVIDVDAFALCNMYEVNYDILDVRRVALVNVGASDINITILGDGAPLFTRDSPMGSSQHTLALEKAFDLSREDAEKVKKGESLGSLSAEKVETVMRNASDELYAEIYRSFEYFKSSVSDVEIDEIVVSGGAALIKGFADLMAERLRIPVKVADPFRRIAVPEKLDAGLISQVAPIAAVAVGLALRREGDR